MLFIETLNKYILSLEQNSELSHEAIHNTHDTAEWNVPGVAL